MSNILDISFWILYMLQVPRMLHIMQQESYQNDGMIRWIAKNPKSAFKKGVIQLFIVLLVYLAFSAIVILVARKYGPLDSAYELAPAMMSLIAFAIISIINFIKDHKERKSAKKPLKYTARAKRLMFYNFIVVIILELLFISLIPKYYPEEVQKEATAVVNAIKNYSGDYMRDEELINRYNTVARQVMVYDNIQNLKYICFVYAFLVFALPVNMIISNWFASPLETAIGKRYIKKAYQKLNQPEYQNLVRIGITGSYGKTSTKFILKSILEEKYKVLATPRKLQYNNGKC